MELSVPSSAMSSLLPIAAVGCPLGGSTVAGSVFGAPGEAVTTPNVWSLSRVASRHLVALFRRAGATGLPVRRERACALNLASKPGLEHRADVKSRNARSNPLFQNRVIQKPEPVFRHDAITGREITIFEAICSDMLACVCLLVRASRPGSAVQRKSIHPDLRTLWSKYRNPVGFRSHMKALAP